MAGHSKWANIKHKKAKEDAKRAKFFTKYIREITVAARLGGGDKDSNPRLRAAIATALSNNMNKDTIERAILKGAGGDDSSNVDELRYEGYGPAGVAIMVDCMTDNKNRTAGEVRHAFSKNGGNLGTDGSVGYMFTEKGIISFSDSVDEDELMDVALDLGSDDVVTHEDGSMDVITTPQNFSDIQEGLVEKGFNAEEAEVTFDAEVKADMDIETVEKVINLIEKLEDLDDVQNVYSNANFTKELMEQLG
jgi:YebC/PmpR family DNA-binding regulatory protein